MRTKEEGTVVSTVRGTNSFVAPIEIVERDDGAMLIRQADGPDSADQILIDRSQLRKLWYVLGMHVDLLDLYDEVERPAREVER